MARIDAIVLGAGIVGTSIALQLARRGLSVALVDRRGPGEETSYGNAGIIGGAGVFPTAFPRSLVKILRVGLKLATEANYHWSQLPRIVGWLHAYYGQSSPQRLEELARAVRPLMAQTVAEHETLMAEADALKFLRKDGWISIYRSDAAFASLAHELAVGEELGVPAVKLDRDGARALEPSLAPVFRHAVHWPDIASVSDPLGVTRAYAARFQAIGGFVLTGDARSLHRSGERWRVETDNGPVDAPEVVLALGPWTDALYDLIGLRFPLVPKRGYHRHFAPSGNATLKRPVVDAEVGYVLAPMEQGIRLTTGAEFAHRDAPPTPVQFDRLLPKARELFDLGAPVEPQPWMGSRPCLPDMQPVIDRVPAKNGPKKGLWLAFGHGHMGLTLGPVTGRLVADMMTGATPFVDPALFRATRFR